MGPMEEQVETKRCTGCGDALPIDAFGWKHRRVGRRHTRCPDCLRAYARSWYERRGDVHRDAVCARRRECEIVCAACHRARTARRRLRGGGG